MKTLLSIFLILTITGLKASPAFTNNARDYIAVISTDDQLLRPGLVDAHIALTLKFFDAFAAHVRQREIVIASHSRFRVAIAPQKGNPDLSVFLDKLLLDVGALPLKDRVRELERFRSNLPSNLRLLYEVSLRNRHQKADFAGSNLWQFFNGLSNTLSPSSVTILMVLSDGYLDFNRRSTSTLRQKNRFTDTTPLLTVLRNHTDWSDIVEEYNYGLIPVRQLANVSVIMPALLPDKNVSLLEGDILRGIWSKFYDEIGIQHHQITAYISSAQSCMTLTDFLKSQ